MPDYIGNWGCFYSVENFIKNGKDHWMTAMQRNSHRVTGYAIERSQVDAWEDEYDTLCRVFEQLPENLKKCTVAFEYVLPGRKPGTRRAEHDQGIRCDAVLIGKSHICTLELKRRREPTFNMDISQAKRYTAKIQKYHARSAGMQVTPVLLLTRGHDIRSMNGELHIVTPDHLAEALTDIMDNDSGCSCGDARLWLESEFVGREDGFPERRPPEFFAWQS